MKYSGAQIIVHLLERQGISLVTGIPGGSNLPLYDALMESSLRHVLTRHEQGAGFIAQGAARTTGTPAVCLVTSGPGVTNLLTAIADAHMDSVPLVAITGQVPLSLMGSDAFQEIDTFGLSLPITKHVRLVRRAEELLTAIPEAFRVAASGRPGPVVVDVPKDVQNEIIELDSWPDIAEPRKGPGPSPADLREFRALLDRSERPLLLAGGGASQPDTAARILRFVEREKVPAVMTLRGLGILPADHPLSGGMVGMHGHDVAHDLLDACDLLIVAGSRFGDRVTGKKEAFCPHARIIHIDIDGTELGKIRSPDLGIVSDVGLFLEAFLNSAFIDPAEERSRETEHDRGGNGTGSNGSHRGRSRQPWMEQCQEIRDRYGANRQQPFSPFRNSRPHGATKNSPFHPGWIVREISRMVPEDSIITTDVGQHQMWVAGHFQFRYPGRFLTSAGLGTMGFGFPAAIGAALAAPGRRVFCFSGDGSFLMNLQELATLAETRADVTIFVMDNGQLGLVRQQQELFYGSRLFQSVYDRRIDFVAIARGFGVEAVHLEANGDAGDATGELERLVAHRGPLLVQIPVDPEIHVLPMVPPGAPGKERIRPRDAVPNGTSAKNK